MAQLRADGLRKPAGAGEFLAVEPWERDRQTAEKAGWSRSQEGAECQVKGLGFVPGLGNGRGLSGLWW